MFNLRKFIDSTGILRSFGDKDAVQPDLRPAAGSIGIIERIDTDSGNQINEDIALRISTVLTCVEAIYDSVGSVSGNTYQKIESGRQIAREHPAYSLLHDAPNDYMTASELWGLLASHRKTFGNGYAFIDFEDGVPVSIQPLLPDRTWCELANGQLIYKTSVDGGAVSFLPYQVIHVKGLGFDGITGYPKLRMIRNDLGAEKAAGEFGGKFYQAGANMGGVISMKGSLSEEAKEKFKNAIQNQYVGNSNAFKLLMLEEGWTFEKFGVTPVDGSLIESRKLMMRKIAAAFKVPPHKVGDDSRTSFSSLEQENRYFYIECINPELRAIENQVNLKMFTEADKGTYYFEFNRMGFLQADLATQSQHFHLMLQDRVYVPNEVREYYGLNPLPDGDKPLSTPNNNAADPSIKAPDLEGDEGSNKPQSE